MFTKILLLAALSMSLSACTGTTGSRPCGSFDLPQGEEWSTVGAVGESATYVDASGESLSLTLLSREDNEPYTGADRFGAEEVNCRKTSLRRYSLLDRDAGLTIELRQTEGFEQPFEDQPFFIAITPESPVGTALDYGFLLEAQDPLEFYGEAGITEPFVPLMDRVLTGVEIGEARYEIAVESVYTDPEYVLATVPEGAPPISGVVLAEGGGLVRIDFASGERFVRSGPPRP